MTTRIRVSSVISGFLILPAVVSAQVTHGQKPQLPAPYSTKSAGNSPRNEAPPPGFLPTVPQGFRVNVFASDFKRPRWLTVAPNGDIFLAENGANQIVVLRDPQNTGGAQQREVFATGTTRVFGIAFKDDYVYVGNMTALVRFHYDPKTSKRLGEAEQLMKLPGGGHDTRSVAFSADGKHLFVAVGSGSNISTGEDPIRAAITICDPDGKNARLFATGLRNPVGLAMDPITGELWTSVNERDELGDDLPPDYFTSVKDGGFYGWPYSYIGSNVDDRVKPQKPELGGEGDCSGCVARRASSRRCSLRFIRGSSFRRAIGVARLWPSTVLGTARRARDIRLHLWRSRTGSLRPIRCRS